MPDYLDTATATNTGRRIAYHQTAGAGPGIVFLGGFKSDMEGTKAIHLEAWAKAQGRAFLPQVLVGSSMGGWMSLLMTKRIPERIAALVTIAAAPDFTEDSMWGGFTDAQKAELEAGQVALPSDYGEPYIITKRLIEEGRNNLVLRAPLPLPFPVRFLQGTADTDVDMSVALRLLDHAEGPDMQLTLLKGADHRFSDGPALDLIEAAVSDVLKEL